MIKYKIINLFNIKKKKIGKLYILSGKFKKQKLIIKNNFNLRPSINLIRKILINWLKPNVKNSICLDCFAGSGILGIEALSNYAKKVIFIENNKDIFLQLKKNLNFLNCYKYNLFNINSLEWLKNKKKIRFNIVFLDPPFKKKILNKIIYLLEKNNFLYNNSLIYIQTNINDKILNLPKNWYIVKKKIISKILIRLYLRLKNNKKKSFKETINKC